MKLPALPEPFPPAFLGMLHSLVAHGRRLFDLDAETARSRRKKLAQSGIFVGHRVYSSGDDLRHLDWHAYARSGSLLVKQFEEEQRRTVAIVVDRSASMWAGSPPRLLQALRLGALLGGIALGRVDQLRLTSHGPGTSLPEDAPFDELLRCLRELPDTAMTPLQQVRDLLRLGQPGRVLWLSDFADPESFAPALAALRRHGVRTVGWLPELPGDRELPGPGWTAVIDPESGVELRVAVDAALLRELQRQLELLARRQSLVFGQVGGRLVRCRLPVDERFDRARWREALWNSLR